MQHRDALFKKFAITLTWLWLGVFVLAPYGLVLVSSFLKHSASEFWSWHFSLESYSTLLSPIYLKIFLKSFYLALVCTLLCLLLGYPCAYILARKVSRHRQLLLLLAVIPSWTSSLVRSYAMIGLLKTRGILNTLFLGLGIIHSPMQLLFTNTAVMIGLVYNLLPFMILPLYASIERFDGRLIEAAQDLGANSLRTFRQITLPLTMPGILAGSLLVFLPATTLFYIPDLLGGAKSLLLGNIIESEYLVTNNWPLGSAISIMLTVCMGILLLIYRRSDPREDVTDLI